MASQGDAENLMQPRPTVSVIIPTYNRAHYVGDAIRSILAQTFGDFELIVVDDGSTDRTAAVVGAVEDRRLRLVRHEQNRGIPHARNTGLDQARGEFIAWLDSDDVARPDRLQAQLGYLREHARVAMVGSCAGKLRADGRRRWGARVPPLSPADVGAWLLFRSPFQQSSVMGRSLVLRGYRYRAKYPVCEDIDMFLQLHRSHRIENLPRVLIDRRIHKDQTIRVRRLDMSRYKMELLELPLQELGMSFSDEELRRHTRLAAGAWDNAPPDRDFLTWAEVWMRSMRRANDGSGRVDAAGLRLATSVFWLRACVAAAPSVGVLRALATFATSPLSTGLVSRHASNWLKSCVPLLIAGGACGLGRPRQA